MVNYFFDTYAIIELLKRNPNYLKYNEFPLITTILNKIELCWWAMHNHDEKLARILMKSIYNPVEITDELIEKAVKFRIKHKEKDISYADSIGYTFARENNLLFLTGDQAFANISGVEYVK